MLQEEQHTRYLSAIHTYICSSCKLLSPRFTIFASPFVLNFHELCRVKASPLAPRIKSGFMTTENMSLFRRDQKVKMNVL